MNIPAQALRIGVTIGLRSEDESLWINGIKQNALFLAKLLQSSPLNHQVSLVNTTDVRVTEKLPWDLKKFRTLSFSDAKDDLDVLIELGGQVSPDQTSHLKDRNTRIVSYCCGPEYNINSQMILSRKPGLSSSFMNRRYDQVWIIPQVEEGSFHYLKTLRRRPAQVVPFVWDPMCLEERARALPGGGLYRPRGRAKRLSVIEPNRDLMKFCLYPVLLAELAYRAEPDLIEFLHVTNADQFVTEDFGFPGIMRQLDIVNEHKASFVGSFSTPDFLSNHTDIVVSHQTGLALNYMYLEVCWQGYALVHNAHLVPELGYYYHANDIDEGATLLRRAIRRHDDDYEGYRSAQRYLIRRFLASNPELSASYDRLLLQLMEAEPAP